jgi:hypothetical protein
MEEKEGEAKGDQRRRSRVEAHTKRDDEVKVEQ